MVKITFALGIPPKFKYTKVKDLDETLEKLKEGAKPLAGGQSILPMLKLRITRFDHLVDINSLNLRYIKTDEDTIRIGALATHSQIAKLKKLSKVALTIADLQVRNRGTIGGSLVNADPSANYYPALLVMNAKLKLTSKDGERIVNLKDFFESPYQTKIKEDELLTEIIIDKKEMDEKNIFKFSIFKKGGSAYPNVIVAMKKEEENSKIKIGLGAIFEKPVLVEVEDRGEKTIEDIFSSIELKPLSDNHTSGETKVKIAKNMIKSMLNDSEAKSDVIIVGEENLKENAIGNQDNNYYTISLSNDEKMQIKIRVNDVEIEDTVESRTLLLDFLRSNGFKEVKRGCDEGKCGACTVLLNGKAIKSCLTLAVQAIGSDVRTIKGLNDDVANKIKNSFVKNFAMQCGYCTHGFMIATYDYLKNIDPKANDETLKYSIKNICRCTGYINIIKAIKESRS
ncbi:2Fe-2S iron-sulfur cluster binding domain-containing protein [Acidianus sulfidivorans JP7]|uniref:Carbon monoxide dehydrogenase n=1 Tax=Acidianus sulfidivorans JP7 TaxID=619593 RepID=A0A2U9IJS3_9CREN|nr:FAD binding domain-containing protein [Acidianus sulfidivorans]AWR96184.1 2Fe-2S iron-sulfur cluster binding domain-containing protein [Acidianus sulfidivorans JP7]